MLKSSNIENFYMTDSVSRNSLTMSKCSVAFNSKKMMKTNYVFATHKNTFDSYTFNFYLHLTYFKEKLLVQFSCEKVQMLLDLWFISAYADGIKLLTKETIFLDSNKLFLLSHQFNIYFSNWLGSYTN